MSLQPSTILSTVDFFMLALPAGGSKSLLFRVLACTVAARVTVVVVLCQTLIQDAVSCFQQRSINCVKSSLAVIKIVTADAVGEVTSKDNFSGYANMLCSKDGSRRVLSHRYVERLVGAAGKPLAAVAPHGELADACCFPARSVSGSCTVWTAESPLVPTAPPSAAPSFARSCRHQQ